MDWWCIAKYHSLLANLSILSTETFQWLIKAPDLWAWVVRKTLFVPQWCPMFSWTNGSVICHQLLRNLFKHHTIDATPMLLMEMTSQEDVVVKKEIGASNAVHYLATSSSCFQDVLVWFCILCTRHGIRKHSWLFWFCMSSSVIVLTHFFVSQAIRKAPLVW